MKSSIGPESARILIVGDHWGADDAIRGLPWQGTAGAELQRMLAASGIDANNCRMTNILSFRPNTGDLSELFDFRKDVPLTSAIPQGIENVNREIDTSSPTLVIGLGGLATYMATNSSAVSTWRGSELQYTTPAGTTCKFIPTYHPTQIMRNWAWRAIALTDLRRAAREAESSTYSFPEYDYIIRPSFAATMECLHELYNQVQAGPVRLSVDIETRLNCTACIGIAWSRVDAICIPLMCTERPEGYWMPEEELAITLKLRELLTHPNAQVVGQNFLYDTQYFAKESGYTPHVTNDTMLMQHVLFPGMPKGLDFLASMYCEHYVYWKGEGKDWNPSVPEEQLWVYNCKDACYTYEISEVLPEAIAQAGLSEQYKFQMNLWYKTLRMMLRGVRIDMKYRQQLAGELMAEASARESFITSVVGHPLNPKSPKQMQAFFYHDLQLKKQINRKNGGGITCNEEALQTLMKIEPVVKPICKAFLEMRSIGVFLSNFVRAQVDPDGKMRSSFNPAGTETFRYASSKNAFDGGTNFQNVPKGDEDEEHDGDSLILPNIRKLFLPDPNKIIIDVDLAGADAQVVAWEANDDILKEVFRTGQKLHAFNAKDLFGGDAGPDGKREPYYTNAKKGCHLSNYGGKARTMSAALGITVHEAEKFQKRWFEIHPGILEWHRRVEAQLQATRTIRNKFGYRRFYFDRIDTILPEGLAWIPQSTVACVTNRQMIVIEDTLPQLQILIQVHDSLVMQCDAWRWPHIKPRLYEALRILIPYDDPLIIGNGLKTSTVSWGHCEEEKWK